MSAPVLGFDLSRLPGGSAVAEVLLRALTLDQEDLEPLAELAGDDWDRLPLWQEVEHGVRRRRDLAAKATANGAGPQSGGADLRRRATGATGATGGADGNGADKPGPDLGEAELAGALAALERTPIGTVDGLLHCLRHDVLDWTWRRHPAGLAQLKPADRAATVLCDAAVAAYLRDVLPEHTRRRLSVPWTLACRRLPTRAADVGPHADAVNALLARVRALTPGEARRLTAVVDQARPAAGDWAGAVHSASWAVFVSGRVRAAATAQLLLVQAVDSARIPVADRAGGAWNVLSGAVQALAVRDVLDAATLYRLLDPVVAAIGPITPAVSGGADSA